jgi:hypothetical protein
LGRISIGGEDNSSKPHGLQLESCLINGGTVQAPMEQGHPTRRAMHSQESSRS